MEQLVWEADYDGDQLSLRGLWSDEANDEAEKMMATKMSALDITGGNSKGVAKEVFNSFYEMTKVGNKSVKVVIDSDWKNLMNIRPKDITRSLLANLFADLSDASGKPNASRHRSLYNSWDKVTIPPNYFYQGQPEIDTTIGRFVMNKFVLGGPGVIGHVKYINDTMDAKKLKGLDSQIAKLYMTNQITRDQFDLYMDYRDTFGYWMNGMVAHTISPAMAQPIPAITKKKEELIKKYEKELADHNVDVMTKIVNELMAYAKEVLKDDPGMDLYDSGDLNFDNNYRNNSIIKGAVMNQLTGEFDFIGTSMMDGLEVKDMPAHANGILASQYPASIATAKAGYMGKKLLALLQMMEIDYDCEDCGTKNLIPLKITNYNKSYVKYTIFVENNKEKELTDDIIDSYVGKEIMMRSPISCINDKICAKCASNLFKMLDIKHAGLFVTQISHSALNLGLKAKHRSVVELATLNPDDIIKDI